MIVVLDNGKEFDGWIRDATADELVLALISIRGQMSFRWSKIRDVRFGQGLAEWEGKVRTALDSHRFTAAEYCNRYSV